jgi:hypothetical protein
MSLNTKYKILPSLWNDANFNESTIDFLKLHNLNGTRTNSFESSLVYDKEPTKVLCDLHEYKGVTYTNNEDGAVPAENFTVNEEGTAWTFRLPIWGFKVVHDEPLPPVGPYTWEYITSVFIIKERINFKDLPDSFIKKAKVINFLFTDNDVALPNMRMMLDPIEEIYTEFAYFQRWVKVANGYDLEFYAIIPFTAEPEPKLQLKVYFLNKDLGNESQSLKV